MEKIFFNLKKKNVLIKRLQKQYSIRLADISFNLIICDNLLHGISTLTKET